MNDWLSEDGVGEPPQCEELEPAVSITIDSSEVSIYKSGHVSVSDNIHYQRFDNLSEFSRSMPELCGQMLLLMSMNGIIDETVLLSNIETNTRNKYGHSKKHSKTDHIVVLVFMILCPLAVYGLITLFTSL